MCGADPSGSICVDERIAFLPVSPSNVSAPMYSTARGLIATRTENPFCTRRLAT